MSVVVWEKIGRLWKKKKGRETEAARAEKKTSDEERIFVSFSFVTASARFLLFVLSLESRLTERGK